MKRSDFQRWLPLVLVLVIALSALLFAARRGEPKFQGRSLTDWLEEIDRGNTGGRLAVQEMGTNAVPNLILMLGSKESRLTRHLPRFVRSLVGQNPDSVAHRHMLGVRGFEA